ncbi:MAG: DsbA family protein [Fimbriimonadales bacterium]|nr:DsbA family protein [Fimbriimonadales bacterium]
MAITIPVAHDYICPWCYIGLFQAKRLQEEFGVRIEWLGYELMPEELPWPDPKPAKEADPNRPPTPSRLDLALAAADLELPPVDRPKRMRSHHALEATEHAKELGCADAFVERLYRAYWEEGREINDPSVLAELARPLFDPEPMLGAIAERRYADRIVAFDDEAYSRGVFNVPTFFIGGERYAEQPYRKLAQAVRKVLR